MKARLPVLGARVSSLYDPEAVAGRALDAERQPIAMPWVCVTSAVPSMALGFAARLLAGVALEAAPRVIVFHEQGLEAQLGSAALRELGVARRVALAPGELDAAVLPVFQSNDGEVLALGLGWALMRRYTGLLDVEVLAPAEKGVPSREGAGALAIDLRVGPQYQALAQRLGTWIGAAIGAGPRALGAGRDRPLTRSPGGTDS